MRKFLKNTILRQMENLYVRAWFAKFAAVAHCRSAGYLPFLSQ